MTPLVTFWLLLKASLLSFSGMGNVPILHADLMARGWATEEQFAEALAVGQMAPGPNGLWVICFAYFLDGLRGALMALVAIILPPLLVLVLERLYRRVKDHPAIEGFVRGLSLAATGMFGVVMVTLLHSAGVNLRSLLIASGALVLSATRRVPVIVILALAGLVGALLR